MALVSARIEVFMGSKVVWMMEWIGADSRGFSYSVHTWIDAERVDLFKFFE